MPWRNLATALAVVALLAIAQPVTALTTNEMEACLIQSIQEEREERGLPRLRFDETLVDYARDHSRAMARRGELFHSSAASMNAVLPTGWTGWGQNVGRGGTCRQLHEAFMDSPAHRAILSEKDFNNVAIGVITTSDGSTWVTEILYGHPSTSAPLGPFWDDDGSVHEPDIITLERAGVTSGCGNGRFCPDQSLTRGEMAAFLARALDLPTTGRDFFTDDDGSVFEGDINALAAAGVTSGCGGGKYCPNAPVTRGQMAAFLARAFDLPAVGRDYFSDDAGSVFEGDINALAAAGITRGCGADRFCPELPVTRAQMASFLVRAFDW